MQHEDDLRALAKVAAFIAAVGIVCNIMNIYWFCYEWFRELGWTFDAFDRTLRGFQTTTELFSTPLYSKLFALLMLLISCLGIKGVKSQKIGWRQIIVVGSVGAFVYFFNSWLLDIPASVGTRFWLYTLTLFVGYACMLTAGTWVSRIVRNNLLDDVFNDENESFMQETRPIINEYSVNLPTLFRYRGRLWRGWLSPAIFRGTICVGLPGSGKSFAVINNFIKQLIERGFSLYIYGAPVKVVY